MPTVNRQAPDKTHTQSMRFRKPQWTKDESKKWVVEHDGFIDGYDETENEHRWRQYDPDYEKFDYRTLENNLPAGVYFITGYKKGSRAFMQNKLVRVLTSLCCDPWLITPYMHRLMTDIVYAHSVCGIMEAEQHLIAKDYEDDECESSYMVESGVAIFNVDGVIGRKVAPIMQSSGMVSVDLLQKYLMEAKDRKDVNCAMMIFDSPGGTARGIPECAEAVRSFAQVKPIFSFVDGQCCSAAYWLASQTDCICATPSSDVGSIGVYCAVLDESRSFSNAGKEVQVFKSGDYKGMGLPGTSLTSEQKKMIQASVDRIGVDFRQAVRDGRNTISKQISDEVMQGQAFAAADAKQTGLINEVCDLDSSMRLLLAAKDKISARSQK